MSIAEMISVGFSAAAVIFAAGGFYVQSKGTRQQVNGVGRKVGKVILYLGETAKGEQRQRLTDILKD